MVVGIQRKTVRIVNQEALAFISNGAINEDDFHEELNFENAGDLFRVEKQNKKYNVL